MTEAVRTPSTRRPNEGGVIESVREGSIAHEAGLRAGDRVLRIGERTLRDAVDYQFHAADAAITLEVLRGDAPQTIEIEKHPDEDLGIAFQDAAFDGVRTCNNACFFCFLKGNPKGMRKTLYVKDDDYRLSFFHGNFVTLTNLEEDDWERLAEQRLSPINVSVHATDVELRRYLLGNKTAPDIVAQLRRLGETGIRAHTQVVLCPGVNDGAALDRTIDDLAALYPSVQTISVVPVGATMTAEERVARGQHADEIEGITRAYARSVIAQSAPRQHRFRSEHGTTLLYLADEFYLIGGVALPAARHYDGFAQYENGIGMARSLLEDWRAVRRRMLRAGDRPAGRADIRAMTIVCGTLIGPTMASIAGEFGEIAGIDVRVVPVENRFFGPRVNVSGLLVAGDVADALRGRDLGDLVVLPRYTLDYTGRRFLDDDTPDQVQRALGVPLAFASTMREVLQILTEPVDSPLTGAATRGETTAAAVTNGKSWVDWSDAAPAPLGGRGLAKEVRR
jgi:putative radical SAM enzyme (TIGR03279 family)